LLKSDKIDLQFDKHIEQTTRSLEIYLNSIQRGYFNENIPMDSSGEALLNKSRLEVMQEKLWATDEYNVTKDKKKVEREEDDFLDIGLEDFDEFTHEEVKLFTHLDEKLEKADLEKK